MGDHRLIPSSLPGSFDPSSQLSSAPNLTRHHNPLSSFRATPPCLCVSCRPSLLRRRPALVCPCNAGRQGVGNDVSSPGALVTLHHHAAQQKKSYLIILSFPSNLSPADVGRRPDPPMACALSTSRSILSRFPGVGASNTQLEMPVRKSGSPLPRLANTFPGTSCLLLGSKHSVKSTSPRHVSSLPAANL